MASRQRHFHDFFRVFSCISWLKKSTVIQLLFSFQKKLDKVFIHNTVWMFSKNPV